MNILGIDIGGTKCSVTYGVQTGQDLKVVDKIQFKTKAVTDTIQEIIASLENMMTTHWLNAENTAAIGISCGGPLDSQKGVIMSPPNLPDWDNIPIVEIITSHIRIPSAIQNDANACALAEWQFGAGRGCCNMVFLTFGTGMGAGLILNGKLYSGTNDNAGEAGHIRLADFGPVGYGKTGSFEGFCSGGGIAQLAKMKVLEKIQQGQSVSWVKNGEVDNITAQMVAVAAQNGDELALEIYRISSVYLGKGLSIIIDLLNPEMIVIGSIYTRNKELIDLYMMEVLEKESLPLSACVCEVRKAALGENIGDYAALSVAVDLLNSNK
jgi:glucokinase